MNKILYLIEQLGVTASDIEQFITYWKYHVNTRGIGKEYIELGYAAFKDPPGTPWNIDKRHLGEVCIKQIKVDIRNFWILLTLTDNGRPHEVCLTVENVLKILLLINERNTLFKIEPTEEFLKYADQRRPDMGD